MAVTRKTNLWLKNEADLSWGQLSKAKYAILQHPYYNHLYDRSDILIYDAVFTQTSNSRTNYLLLRAISTIEWEKCGNCSELTSRQVTFSWDEPDVTHNYT